MEFSRPEYWSGLLFPSPGDLPNPGIEPRSPSLQVDSLPAEPQGKPTPLRMKHQFGTLLFKVLFFNSKEGLSDSRIPTQWMAGPTTNHTTREILSEGDACP